jgi:hypothetical protein
MRDDHTDNRQMREMEIDAHTESMILHDPWACYEDADGPCGVAEDGLWDGAVDDDDCCCC